MTCAMAGPPAAATKPTILALVAHYLPGFRAGGPLRSLANLVERLGDEFAFRILTSDRDFGAAEPYPDVFPAEWQRVAGADVYYASPREFSWAGMRRLLVETPHDVLYLNSLFNPAFSLQPMMLRALRLVPDRPVVLAPRGELSPGALAIRAAKKRLALGLTRRLRLHDGVLWQASSAYEAAEIRRHFAVSGKKEPEIAIAPNLPTRFAPSAAPSPADAKRSGHLRAVFLSRIARKKNLDGALRLLHALEGEVLLDVYGPREDPAYWSECESRAAALPHNVTVSYRGDVAHAEVPATFANYDVFLFPTHGENFGHVIIEALGAGCPVLTSEHTPFRDLEPRGAGWSLPLDRTDRWREVLQRCIGMDAAALARLRASARAYAEVLSTDDDALDRNRDLFRTAAQRAARAPRRSVGLNTSRTQYIA